MIAVDKIGVNYSNLEGVARRPFAHICGLCLELPFSYQNFRELREEFQNILESNNWAFDIV